LRDVTKQAFITGKDWSEKEDGLPHPEAEFTARELIGKVRRGGATYGGGRAPVRRIRKRLSCQVRRIGRDDGPGVGKESPAGD